MSEENQSTEAEPSVPQSKVGEIVAKVRNEATEKAIRQTTQEMTEKMEQMQRENRENIQSLVSAVVPDDRTEEEKQRDDLAQIKADIAKQREEAEATRKATEAQKQALEEENQKRVHEQGLHNAYVADLESFNKAKPDFNEARLYMRQARAEQLKFTISDKKELEAALDAEHRRIAENAINSGENAAEKIYAFAESLGYKPPVDSTEAKEKLAAQKAGAEMADLSAASATPALPSGLTWEGLLKMPDAERHEAMKRDPGLFDRLGRKAEEKGHISPNLNFARD